jgi:hypothetical protein
MHAPTTPEGLHDLQALWDEEAVRAWDDEMAECRRAAERVRHHADVLRIAMAFLAIFFAGLFACAVGMSS